MCGRVGNEHTYQDVGFKFEKLKTRVHKSHPPEVLRKAPEQNQIPLAHHNIIVTVAYLQEMDHITMIVGCY